LGGGGEGLGLFDGGLDLLGDVGAVAFVDEEGFDWFEALFLVEFDADVVGGAAAVAGAVAVEVGDAGDRREVDGARVLGGRTER